MMEERLKILEMLSSGIITSSEANELLSTLDEQKIELTTEKGSKLVKMANFVKNEFGKTLHIKVISNEGDKVNVNLPIAVLKAAIKSGTATQFMEKSFNKNSDNDFIKSSIDIDFIIECIDNGVVGEIVDIESADGDIVKIFID